MLGEPSSVCVLSVSSKINKIERLDELKWAGSSLIVFLGRGVESLLSFLAEEDVEGNLLHDIDLYRTTEDTQKLGKAS